MDNSKAAAQIFDKLARQYEDKYMDVSLYHETFDLFCQSIPQVNAQVLEIACGPGNITKYLLQKRPDLKIVGIDLAPGMVALARKNNPEAEFKVMDCREIDQINQKFDAVMCGFCLPYLTSEESINLIGMISKMLNPAGILYLSTMEDDYSKSGYQKGSTGDEIYMNFHEAGYLLKALETSNFKVIELQRIETMTPQGIKVIDLVIISQARI